jgi:Flp pilus assembly pilin Flp
LATDPTGSTLIEYALVAALIAVTCVLVVTNVGLAQSALYLEVCQAVSTAVGAAGC